MNLPRRGDKACPAGRPRRCRPPEDSSAVGRYRLYRLADHVCMYILLGRLVQVLWTGTLSRIPPWIAGTGCPGPPRRVSSQRAGSKRHPLDVNSRQPPRIGVSLEPMSNDYSLGQKATRPKELRFGYSLKNKPRTERIRIG
jgi:hypothetical protein